MIHWHVLSKYFKQVCLSYALVLPLLVKKTILATSPSQMTRSRFKDPICQSKRLRDLAQRQTKHDNKAISHKLFYPFDQGTRHK